MVFLNNDAFEKYLESIWQEISSCHDLFDPDRFEIGLIMSPVACSMFQKYIGVVFSKCEDPINQAHHLFGCRIAFVDTKYIPSETEHRDIIKPLIVCRDIGYFPMNARYGDYVFYNGSLKQVVGFDDTDDGRSVCVRTLGVELYDTPQMHILKDKHINGSIFPDVLAEWTILSGCDDGWAENADTSVLTDYINSLEVT